jgi:predicted CopG family antitoxin
MPRKGYRTITVADQVYNSVQKRAQQNKCSIPQYIKILIDKDGKDATSNGHS